MAKNKQRKSMRNRRLQRTEKIVEQVAKREFNKEIVREKRRKATYKGLFIISMIGNFTLLTLSVMLAAYFKWGR